MVKIMNLPRHKRPRERLLELGVGNLKDQELLAILLRVGGAGRNAIEFAEDILHKFPLEKFLNLKKEDLLKIKGIDEAKTSTILASFELTKRALKVENNNLPIINSARDVADQLSDIRKSKKENLVVFYLNARNHLIHKEIVSVGTINASLIHPREVFAPALKHLATNVILAHNHPSGNCEPTEEDLEITRSLKKAGDVLGIEILDHIIIAENNFLSLKELNLM